MSCFHQVPIKKWDHGKLNPYRWSDSWTPTGSQEESKRDNWTAAENENTDSETQPCPAPNRPASAVLIIGLPGLSTHFLFPSAGTT